MLQKYFIAIIPPEPIFSEIEKIKKTVSKKYNNKSALRSPPHITLHLPFEWKLEKEELLLNAFNDLVIEAPIEIQVSNYSAFAPTVVFMDVVPNEKLAQLQLQIVQQAKQKLFIFNQADDVRKFHPHITIAFRDLKKADFYNLMSEYSTKTFNAVFNVQSFCLLKHIDKKWQVYKEYNSK